MVLELGMEDLIGSIIITPCKSLVICNSLTRTLTGSGPGDEISVGGLSSFKITEIFCNKTYKKENK